MASFLKKNSKHELTILSHSLVGKVGFSLTRDSVKDLAGSLFSYSLKNDITQFTVGYGNSNWSKAFADFLIESLNQLGFIVEVPDKPCTLAELSWLVTQGKKRVGIYLSQSIFTDQHLKIDFFTPSGAHFTSKEFKTLLKSQSDVETQELKDQHNIEYRKSVDISLFPKYLVDSKQLTLNPAKKIKSIDCMFGATEYLLTNAVKEASNVKYGLLNKSYNLDSDAPRLSNYQSNPTGKFLSWYSSFPGVKDSEGILIAFDGAGERFGIYDLKQKVELSVDSVALLLLTGLKDDFCRDVVLSSLFSSNVITYAKKLGFKVKVSDKQLQDFPDPICLYADGLGYFAVKGLPNPLKVLEIIDMACAEKSPGELIDSLKKKKDVICQAGAVYKDEAFLDLMAKKLEKCQTVKNTKFKDNIHIVTFIDKSRILLTFDPLQNIGINKIEAKSNDSFDMLRITLKDIIMDLL